MRCNEVERAVFKCPMSRQDWELLEKYAKKYKDKESGQFAQDMLDMKRGNQTPDEDMEEDDVLIEGIYEEETIPLPNWRMTSVISWKNCWRTTSTSS